MLPGSLVGGDVRSYTSTVLVNGVERPHVSWSVDRELTGDLPVQVAAVGAVTQASGTIDWAQAEDVTERPTTPFNASTGWVPAEGDRVQIYVSDGETSFPRFTGRIDDVEGDVESGFSSTIIDDYDALNVAYAHTAVMHKMPPPNPGGDTLKCGMSPMHILADAAWTAGYTSVWGPPSGSRAVMALGQGTTWPRVGTLVESTTYDSDPQAVPLNRREPWGWAINDFQARYAPAQTIGGGTPLQINLSVGLQHQGSAHVIAQYSSTDTIRLQINESGGVRTAILRRNNVDITSVTLSGNDLSVAARYVPPDGGSATYLLETESTSASGTADGVSGVMERVYWRCFAGGSVAGLFVCRVDPGMPLLSASYAPNLKVDISFQYVGSYTPIRHIIDSTARKTIEKIAKSLLLGVYFDESGNLIMRSADRMFGDTPDLTLSTRDNIVGLRWKRDALSVRQQVRVSYLSASVSFSRYPTLTAMTGSSDRIEPGDVIEEFYETPEDKDFIQLAAPQGAWAGAEADMNSRRGSWVGASYTTDGTNSFWANTLVEIFSAQINGRVWKHTITADSSFPSGAEMSTETVSEGSGTTLRRALRGRPLPILRCMGRETWTEAVTAWATTGASFGGVLEHDIGPWGGHGLIPTRIRDRIAAYVAAPLPQITGLDIIADPRTQLTDVAQVASDQYMGARITGMVVAVRDGHSRDRGYGMSLGLRSAESEETFQTYSAWNASGPDGQTYTEFNAGGVETYTEFNSDMEA